MGASLYICIASVILFSVFVGRKVYLLRSGRMMVIEEDRRWRIKGELRKIYIVFRFIAFRLFKYFIFTIGKLSILLHIHSKKFLKARFPKIFTDDVPEADKRPSVFLSTIHEYKAKMRRYKRKIESEKNIDK